MSHSSGLSVPSLASADPAVRVGADGKKHRTVRSGRELIALRLAPPMRVTESQLNDAPRLSGSARAEVAAAQI